MQVNKGVFIRERKKEEEVDLTGRSVPTWLRFAAIWWEKVNWRKKPHTWNVQRQTTDTESMKKETANENTNLKIIQPFKLTREEKNEAQTESRTSNKPLDWGSAIVRMTNGCKHWRSVFCDFLINIYYLSINYYCSVRSGVYWCIQPPCLRVGSVSRRLTLYS